MKYINIRQLANNQIIVMRNNDSVFFSHESLIAVKDNNGNLYLGSSWDYSATTLKYLKIAFNLEHLSKKEIQQRLDDGVFMKLKDYNEA